MIVHYQNKNGKLSIDQVRKFKKDFIELNGERETKGSTIMSLVETIEALQQENEQLRAQVAQYREALIIANHRMPDVGQFCACGKCKTCGADINYVGYEHCVKCARVIIDEALSGTPADYHNPADVAEIELLKIARDNWKKTAGILEDALKKERDVEAIDALLGGEVDGKD